LDDGFLKVNLSNAEISVNDIKVEGFYHNKMLTDTSLIKYNESLELHLISEKFGFNSPRLFYKLNNNSEFVIVENNRIVLNNLSSGKQQVSLYYFDGNKYNEVTKYKFSVTNPWYLSFGMIMIYIVLIVIVFYLYYRWTKIRYTEKLKRIEEEINHLNQIEQIKTETINKLKMQEYEKHILEIQVQTKASEVAGKSLSIAKQSEMIESIETILNSENDSTQLKSKIKKAIKSNSINKNEWQNFEKNLMKSHEDFVHKLTQTYSHLTSKDIKLCIFLRMNLASKEIAPLMNISYRGVELHRYRLRKKLNISKDENLSNFMINI
jgi:DNA-binding NarL/FixJ family response regulator